MHCNQTYLLQRQTQINDLINHLLNFPQNYIQPHMHYVSIIALNSILSYILSFFLYLISLFPRIFFYLIHSLFCLSLSLSPSSLLFFGTFLSISFNFTSFPSFFSLCILFISALCFLFPTCYLFYKYCDKKHPFCINKLAHVYGKYTLSKSAMLCLPDFVLVFTKRSYC